jgi:hypothetical protein
MGYRYYDYYISSEEYPTLAEQLARQAEIDELMRQEGRGRLVRVEQQSEMPQTPRQTGRHDYLWHRLNRMRREREQERLKAEQQRQLQEKWGWSWDRNWVYFIYIPAQDEIKIGFSSRLQERFRELQLRYGEDIELLGATMGDTEDEKILHKIFNPFVDFYERECFLPVEPIRFYIKHFCQYKKL